MTQRNVSLEGPNKRFLVRRPSSLFNLWMDDLLEDFLPGNFMNAVFITPRVDILDQGDYFELCAELPGMEKKDIDVEINENLIVIKGEKKMNQEINEEKYFHREMTYGKILREITLPEKINQEKVKATYENGLLKITLPKADRVKASKIELT